MINFIRREWLPRALPDLAVWFVNFAKQFADVFASLGFTAADNTSVQNDNATVQWLNDSMQVNEASAAAMRSFRDQTLYGEKNDAPPDVPSTGLPAPPAALTASIVQRVVNLKEKIELANGYTPDIGALLGIVVPPTGGISEADVKPTLKAFPAAENYDFAVVVENRAKSDQNELQYRVMNQEKWESLLRFTGKSADARYKPTPEGQPVKIEVRILLYRKNEKYGQPSDAVYVTLNP